LPGRFCHVMPSSRISGAKSGAGPLVYVMKDATRLAQRLSQQVLD
jgi:hypothetical protein